MWGTVLTSMIWGTLMKKSSMTKKFAVFITLFHIGGIHI